LNVNTNLNISKNWLRSNSKEIKLKGFHSLNLSKLILKNFLNLTNSILSMLLDSDLKFECWKINTFLRSMLKTSQNKLYSFKQQISSQKKTFFPLLFQKKVRKRDWFWIKKRQGHLSIWFRIQETYKSIRIRKRF